MLRRVSNILILLALGACTLMPETAPTPLPAATDVPVSTSIPATLVPTATISLPTIIPTGTPEPVLATESPAATFPATLEPHSGAPAADEFELVAQPTTPRQMQNFAHPAQGCSWSGIGGQVFDAEDLPVDNLVIVVTGELNGAPIDLLALTGLAPAYGPGGYEIVLAQQAVASTAPLYVQVFDLDGTPISFPIPFDTSAECDKNLVIVNFVRAP